MVFPCNCKFLGSFYRKDNSVLLRRLFSKRVDSADEEKEDFKENGYFP